MAEESPEFESYFPVGGSVVVGTTLFNNSFQEGNATIISLSGNTFCLLLQDNGFPALPGVRVVVTGTEGWYLCRCEAEILAITDGTHIQAEVVGPLEVHQRREFFRSDVFIPVLHSILPHQELKTAREDWEVARGVLAATQPIMVPCVGGFKVIHWRKRITVKPVMANLSGSGIRIATAESLTPGTLLRLDIFLPLVPPRVITALGSVIRSIESAPDRCGKASYLTALHFECIDNRDRETLISYIFMAERNLLRKKADERAEFLDEEQE